MEMYFSKGKRPGHIMNDLELKTTSINGILKTLSSAHFTDFLESYFELRSRKMLDYEGKSIKYIQDNIFTLNRGVILSMYGDTKILNLVLC
jgi:hypothetical protein